MFISKNFVTLWNGNLILDNFILLFPNRKGAVRKQEYFHAVLWLVIPF